MKATLILLKKTPYQVQKTDELILSPWVSSMKVYPWINGEIKCIITDEMGREHERLIPANA